MTDSEQKAIRFVSEAEKKLHSGQGFFGSLFGGSSKVEEAAELYVRAANMFKMAKKWSAAGTAFCNAAALHIKCGSRHDAATCYIDAGNCFRKGDAKEGINCLLKAIEIYTDMGRFTIAAKHHNTIAEIYETELVDIEKAICHYEQAADYYRGEESNSSANKCMLIVAKYSAEQENYDKAIKIYEEVATSSLENSLLKYSAKEHLFRACLCQMCVDLINAEQAFSRYQEMCPSFIDSREYKLLKSLFKKLEEEDVDGFIDSVKEFDSISRLDQWYTTILLRIKKKIQETPDLR